VQEVVIPSQASLGAQDFLQTSQVTHVLLADEVATQIPRLASQTATEHLHVRS
jgi:hypothetical protein